MDMLREKLAQKLGANKVAKPDASVLRVVTNASATAADEHGAVATLPRPPRRKAVAETPHAAAAGEHASHWDYSGTGGPDSWGQMNPEFAKCATGTRQSPIDIRDGIKVNLEAVHFDYKPGGFRVIDNGHTVQVNVGQGSSIEVMGRRYELVQFHFHRPSEERVDGRQFDMVAHLVHKDVEGRLAVVAVLLERGSAQPLVQNIWNNLPLEKGEEVAARSTIDLNDLLPAEHSYFTYMGSLTTPPCSEGVLWMVMKQPVQLSADQIGIFARLYPMNARPIQSVSGRMIKESN
jgi:carbonic anhydrase